MSAVQVISVDDTDEILRVELKIMVRQAMMSALTAREIKTLEKRYLVNDMTLRDIGNETGVCAQTIRVVEARALMKMRKFQIGSYRVIQKLQMLDRRQGGFGNQMKNNQFEFFYLIYKKTDQAEKLLDTFH